MPNLEEPSVHFEFIKARDGIGDQFSGLHRQ